MFWVPKDCIFVTNLVSLKGAGRSPSWASEFSAFVADDGLYQCTVMPFRLCNAPAALMRGVLGGVPNILYSVLWYSHQ